MEELYCFANTRAALLKNAVKLVASLLLVTVNTVHDKSMCSVVTKIFVLTSDNSRQVTNRNVLSSTRGLVSATALGQIGSHRDDRSAKTNCAATTRDCVCVCVCGALLTCRDTHTHTLRHNSLIILGTQGNEQGKCTHIRPVITKKLLAN